LKINLNRQNNLQPVLASFISKKYNNFYPLPQPFHLSPA
jgi:hypothetical protein